MFNPYLVSFQLPNRLAKANPSSSFNKRFTHSNLTVSCTVCLHYLYRFQGSCRRFQRFTVARDNIWDCITSPPPLSTPFFDFFYLFTLLAHLCRF